MEMIVSIFLFMLCASNCILAFAKSDRMSRLAKDRGGAVSAAQSTAEIWKAEGIDGLKLRSKAAASDNGTYVILWNQNWEAADTGDDAAGKRALEEARYRGTLRIREENDGMFVMNISIGYENRMEAESLFELETARYVRPRGIAAESGN